MPYYRFFNQSLTGVLSTNRYEAGTIGDAFLRASPHQKENIRRTGCAVWAPGQLGIQTQDVYKEMIRKIKNGDTTDSFVLVEDRWVDAQGIIGYKNDSKAVNVGPKKVVPAIPFEVHQDLTKFKAVDYMAAVRASCKGIR